jgi:hypothetical protein
MKPSDNPQPGNNPKARQPDAAEDLNRPSGSADDDPAFRQAYPAGTYGYGPKGRTDKPAVSGAAAEPDRPDDQDAPAGGTSALSPLIDVERPDTSLSEAQRGEPPDHTGSK